MNPYSRYGFDLASGYTIQSNLKTLDERAVLTRVIFLETVAGVPGFSAAMIRHLHSLRRLQGCENVKTMKLRNCTG